MYVKVEGLVLGWKPGNGKAAFHAWGRLLNKVISHEILSNLIDVQTGISMAFPLWM